MMSDEKRKKVLLQYTQYVELFNLLIPVGVVVSPYSGNPDRLGVGGLEVRLPPPPIRPQVRTHRHFAPIATKKLREFGFGLEVRRPPFFQILLQSGNFRI